MAAKDPRWMGRTVGPPVLAVALLAALWLLACGEEGDAPRIETQGPYVCDGCNVVMISIDTLRADRVGAYGYERPTSPNLDALAGRSVVFRDVLAQASTTAPSHMTMFSGRYVFEHRNDSENLPLLAELLAERGYRTAAFVDGAQMRPKFGMTKGFETYFVTPTRGGLAEINDGLIQWLRSHRREKFFAFVHTYDVHCPYNPPEPYFSMFTDPAYTPDFEVRGRCGKAYFNQLGLGAEGYRHISDVYDGGVRHADALLQEIFSAVADLDLADETVLLVTSDHGEALGERRHVGHNQMYDVQLKVPWILHLPGQAHVSVAGPVQLVDLLPTLLGVLSVDPPAGLPRPRSSRGDSRLSRRPGQAAPRRERRRQRSHRSHRPALVAGPGRRHADRSLRPARRPEPGEQSDRRASGGGRPPGRDLSAPAGPRETDPGLPGRPRRRDRRAAPRPRLHALTSGR